MNVKKIKSLELIFTRYILIIPAQDATKKLFFTSWKVAHVIDTLWLQAPVSSILVRRWLFCWIIDNLIIFRMFYHYTSFIDTRKWVFCGSRSLLPPLSVCKTFLRRRGTILEEKWVFRINLWKRVIWFHKFLLELIKI